MEVDDFSTREFLKRGGPDGKQPQYDFFAIQWMETQTQNTSPNPFGQAFSESVMDSFNLDYQQPDNDDDGDGPNRDPKPDKPPLSGTASREAPAS